MDLVKGVPITKYCDEHHLTPRQRLELFIPVCQAVQHAHQKGIIHRDLKPSNVLVALYDGKPVPKVIDFGVAKAAGQALTDKTHVTGFGAIVGTLEYMSPEQAEVNQLDVDTRSDIYSLGVLLYELLTGSTPFSKKELEAAGMLEMLRVIREQEPSKPSMKLSTAEGLPTLAANRGTGPAKLTKLVRGELDWIVMKALEKDRNRRYETANALRGDIERDPGRRAGRIRTAERALSYSETRAEKSGANCGHSGVHDFARRRRGRESLAGGPARDAERDAVASRDREADERQRAQAAAAESKAMFDFVHNRILSAARPKGRQGGLGPAVTLRDAIETAVPFVQESFTEQPLVEARIRRILGTSYWYFGDGPAAEKQVRIAHQILEKILGPDHGETLECANDLVVSIGMQGHDQQAAALAEQIIAKLQAQPGSDGDLVLKVKNNLAMSYFELKRYDDAIKLHEEILAMKQARFGDQRSTFITMVNLANCFGRAGRKPEALNLREKTVALQEAKLGVDDNETLMSRHNLSSSYRDAGRYVDALNLDEVTLARRAATLADDHPDTITSMWSKGNDLIHLDRGADAIPVLDECLQRSAGKRIDRNFPDVAGLRLHYFEKAKDAAGCRQTAESGRV